MTPIQTLLTGLISVWLCASGCLGQADERWSWEEFNKRDGQYTVAKTLVARKEPSKQSLFQLARQPNTNKARYEVSEEGLGSFLNRPDRFPNDRGPFPGNNPGFDRPRPGIDNGRPDFGDRRPGLESFNPDRPGFGVARPILPGDRPFYENRPGFDGNRPGFPGNRPGFDNNRPGFDNNRPGFDNNRPGFDNNRPGFDNNRPGFVGNRPGFDGNSPGSRPGFDGNRPGFGGFRPDFDNRPGSGRPGDLGPGPGPNRPGPPLGGNAPGILTGPVASWEKPIAPTNKDPTDFDTCKCKHSFNCKSPGIQFGTCDTGKKYCCYNSPKYGLQDGDGKRPVLIGPPDIDPRINA